MGGGASVIKQEVGGYEVLGYTEPQGKTDPQKRRDGDDQEFIHYWVCYDGEGNELGKCFGSWRSVLNCENNVKKDDPNARCEDPTRNQPL